MKSTAEIHLLPSAKADANAEVVELLERALQYAKDGWLQSCALAGIGSDDWNFTSFSNEIERLRLVGLLESVKQEILSEYLNEKES